VAFAGPGALPALRAKGFRGSAVWPVGLPRKLRPARREGCEGSALKATGLGRLHFDVELSTVGVLCHESGMAKEQEVVEAV
jgi:hypothetical protein